MTDTPNDPSTGDRVNAAIEAAKTAATDLRETLSVAAAGVEDRLYEAVDALSAKIDEIQAAWDERRNTDG